VARVPEISICILAGHRAEQLDACLAGLRSQARAPSFELLIGGNPTAEEVAAVHRQFPDAQVFDTGRRLPGGARNPLIERATGELLLFLDDDVIVPPDLLRRLADTAAAHPEASVFGGPNDTPPSSSRFERVQGAALSSLLGSGPVSRRYGARHRGFADERWFTLCNLAVRRRVMRPFADELVCAEENALLAELRRAGEPMLYEPTLRVFHARRPSWGSFARQMVKYGRGRGQLVRREPATARAAYLAPAALLSYLLALPALVAGLGADLFVLGPLILYAILIGTTSIRIAWSLRRWGDAPLALALIMTIHACYGAGVIRGIVLSGPAARVAAARGAEVEPRGSSATPHPSPATRLVVIEATPPSNGTG
jgi:GT2 family glycosyltransferase